MCGQVRTHLECFGVLLPPRLLLPICPPPQASRQLVIRLRIKRERRKAAFSHSGGSSHIGLLSFDLIVNPFVSYYPSVLDGRVFFLLFSLLC